MVRAARNLLPVGVALVIGIAAARGEPPEPGQAQPRVARVVDERSIELDQGWDAGVRVRQVYDIFAETRAYSLPLSGSQRLRVNRTVVARAVVYQVEGRSARARVFDAKGKVEAQLYATLNTQVAAPEALPPSVRRHDLTPQGPVAWRRTVDVKLDVEVEPGRRAVYEWRTPVGPVGSPGAAPGGAFTRGIEVAPGVFRTTTPENTWIAAHAKGVYEATVKVLDTEGKTALHKVPLESSGADGARAANPTSSRVLFARTNFAGVRDLAFDKRNAFFWLDGSSGFRKSQWIRGVNSDGYDLGGFRFADNDFSALAVDDDFFYLIDKDATVKRWPRNGPLATIFSGDALKIGESGEGNGRFKEPVDLAVAGDGSLYVLDAGQRCVQRFDRDGSFAHSFGKPGKGDHELEAPVALAVTEDGTVYVLDNGRKRIVVYRNGRPVGNDLEVGLPGEDLRGLAVDPYGKLVHVLERSKGSVKTFGPTGSPLAKTEGDDLTGLKNPVRLRVDATRVVHVVDREGASIARFDGADRTDFAGRWGGVELSKNLRLAASSDGHVVAVDRSNEVAWRFDQRGWAIARMGADKTPGDLSTPVGAAVDADGQVYVADAKKTAEVLKYQGRGGAHLKSFGGAGVFENVRHLQMSSRREKLIVLQNREERPLAVVNAQTGEVEASFPPSSPGFKNPDLATFSGRFGADAPKNEPGYFWVVDDDGERVSVLPWSARTPIEVSQEFSKVTGIAANPSGVVFLCDQGNKKIEVFDGSSSPHLGTLEGGWLGEPTCVAADDLGHVFVFDKSGDGRILELAE